MPIFAHPRFGPLKKPVFCFCSKVLGMLPTCFFVFFYIDFVFFFMIFAYFPIFFVKFSAWANANWQISGVICCVSDDHLMQISHNFPTCTVEITQHTFLYGWNYTIHPSVWLKLSCTPSCMVEIILYTLLYGLNYPTRPLVWLKLSSTPLYGWNYPARPLYGWNYPARPLYGWNYPAHLPVWFKLSCTPWKGRSS